MNFEPVPLPEPPSLFDVDTVAAGGAGPFAPETVDAGFEWMPCGLLWPVHELIVDESLPEPAVAPPPSPAASTDVAVAPFPDDLPLPSEIAPSRLRSAAILLLVVVSLAALLATVVGIIIAAIVLALQSALG